MELPNRKGVCKPKFGSHTRAVEKTLPLQAFKTHRLMESLRSVKKTQEQPPRRDAANGYDKSEIYKAGERTVASLHLVWN